MDEIVYIWGKAKVDEIVYISENQSIPSMGRRLLGSLPFQRFILGNFGVNPHLAQMNHEGWYDEIHNKLPSSKTVTPPQYIYCTY